MGVNQAGKGAARRAPRCNLRLLDRLLVSLAEWGAAGGSRQVAVDGAARNPAAEPVQWLLHNQREYPFPAWHIIPYVTQIGNAVDRQEPRSPC